MLGFCCGCVALGVPPPAREAALPLFAEIVWIGDAPAEPARLLSSYAAEVVRARDALVRASPRVLALIDELASTTGPREGRALLIAFARALRARGARALIATHFDGVAEAAEVPHLRIAGLARAALAHATAADLDGALDAIDAAIDRRIVEASAEPAESDALALARILGLDAAVIAEAEAFYRG
jgi:DNA mismatch repair protein MutS2